MNMDCVWREVLTDESSALAGRNRIVANEYGDSGVINIWSF